MALAVAEKSPALVSLMKRFLLVPNCLLDKTFGKTSPVISKDEMSILTLYFLFFREKDFPFHFNEKKLI